MVLVDSIAVRRRSEGIMALSSKNTVPNPIKIQVVFQGGGAKLCLLMAVCNVLDSYEKDGRIEVTRVAGSSAGAIAAVMFASEKAAETYKSEIRSIGRRLLSDMSIPVWWGKLRAITGAAYFTNLNLENFFEELFCRDKGPKRLKDLRIETEVYFTDLYSLNARIAPQDEAIPKALAKSCRFPFAFVGYKSGDTEVDGGLALNLPVDSLKNAESTKGSVIGIGFKGKFGSTSKSGLVSYTQQLFSAAIESGVDRSEAILGPQNVYRTDTDIGTFDFEDALGAGLGVHYDLIVEEFGTWLDTWIEKFGPIQPARPQDGYRLIRPPLSNVPMARAIIREMNDRVRSDPCTRAISVATYETALLNDQGSFTGRYRTRNSMEFRVTRATNVLQFSFEGGKGSTSFTEMKLGCAAFNSNGNSLRFVPDVQETTNPNDLLRSFTVYFLFDQQLTPDSPDQPYAVEYEYVIDDPYPNLGVRGEISSVTRWQGDAQQMILAVAFPREKLKPQPKHGDIGDIPADKLKDYNHNLEEGEHIVPSEDLPLINVLGSLNLEHPPEKILHCGASDNERPARPKLWIDG
jgi:predicted acylesterase/phospholipase RssA